MGRGGIVLLAVAGLLAGVSPAQASPQQPGVAFSYLAGGVPLITSTYLTAVGKAKATVNATVDPEGHETHWELLTRYKACAECALGAPTVAASGTITFGSTGFAGGYGTQLITAKLRHLHPEGAYTYTITASSEAGTTSAAPRTLEATAAAATRLPQEHAEQSETEIPPSIRPHLLSVAEQTAAENGDPEPTAIEAERRIIQRNESPPESSPVYEVSMTGKFTCRSDLRGEPCTRPGEKPLKGKTISLDFEEEALTVIRFGFNKKKNPLNDGLVLMLAGG